MYLSLLEIENFRIFGEDDRKLSLPLRAGLNLLVGENNAGKSAIVDALRLALGTRDHEALRASSSDFHMVRGKPAKSFIIRCTFDALDAEEEAKFIEWLHFVPGEESRSQLRLTLEGTRRDEEERQGRRFDKLVSLEWRAGPDVAGRAFDGDARESLRTTYLKPLRDAEQELSAKRGSRLSQIFGKHPGLETQDDREDKTSLSGIMHEANTRLQEHDVLKARVTDLNTQYLRNLTLGDDQLSARINITPSSLRGILERLTLSIADQGLEDVRHGLGLDNLLFIATEFLLLQRPEAPLRLALIEEPEAHLHPQLQARLVEFLQGQLSGEDTKPVQVILSSHSPNLASKVDVESLTIVRHGQAFPLARPHTRLAEGDYAHLRYFLDVTKANLFFARGLLIVEGDAENLLLPALAQVLGRPLSQYGVSIVNVGHVGLFRYARIFQRPSGPTIDVRVAMLTDRDVPPDEAKCPLDGGTLLVKTDRTTKTGYSEQKLSELVEKKLAHAGDPVRAFVSPEWTLEYDLALHGLGFYLFAACEFAKEAKAGAPPTPGACQERLPALLTDYRALRTRYRTTRPPTREEWACLIYAPLARGEVSKTATASYVAWLLGHAYDAHQRSRTTERFTTKMNRILPAYLTEAISYVTRRPSSLSEPHGT